MAITIVYTIKTLNGCPLCGDSAEGESSASYESCSATLAVAKEQLLNGIAVSITIEEWYEEDDVVIA
jgi:hypothetical protein